MKLANIKKKFGKKPFISRCPQKIHYSPYCLQHDDYNYSIYYYINTIYIRKSQKKP